MRPVLFEIFGYPVASYAVFMALGYLVALLSLYVVTSRTQGSELVWAQVWDLYIVMLVSSLLGSKIGHVLFEASAHEGVNSIWELLKADPWHWIRLDEGGYVWYGGMIGAMLTGVVYFYRRPHLPARLYADAFIPAIMAGAFMGRIGCFLAACCYGEPAGDLLWAVHFPGHAEAVHPTQLYDSAIALGLWILLVWRFSRRRFDGENVALLLLCYPPLRFLTEVWRGDPERGSVGFLSTSQLLSIPLFLCGVALYFYFSRLVSSSRSR